MSPTEYEFPVAPAQAGLLVQDHLHAGSAQYHVPVAYAVDGPFDVAAFRRALDGLVERHEPLRTVFRATEAGHRQVVTAAGGCRAHLTIGRVAGPAEADEAVRAAARRPFDLARGPLLRAAVYAVADGGHRILLNLHHLICDGSSLRLLLDELARGYRAALDGRADPGVPPPLQYADFAVWQRDRLDAGGYDGALAYWRDALRGAPDMLDLPLDRLPSAPPSARGATVEAVLPAGLRTRLAVLARERRTTPFAVLFAVFAAFLGRLSGHTDLVVGVPVSGRDHPDLDRVVGLVATTAAVRVDLSGDPSLLDLVDRVRDRLAASAPHQGAPFSAVVDAVAPSRTAGRDPLVQVVLAYDEAGLDLDLAPARATRVPVPLDVAKVDFALTVERWGGDLVSAFQYRTDLFAPASVRGWLRAFHTLLASALDRPGAPIAAAGLLDRAGRARQLARSGPAAAGGDCTVPELIAAQAARRPGAVALVHGDTVLTYRELTGRAGRMAAVLRSAGVGAEVPVGVCLPRGAGLTVAALAVLLAGGALVPLDVEQPPARLAHMVTGAAARLVIATADTAALVAPTGVPTALLTPDGPGLTPDGPGLTPLPGGPTPGSAGPGHTAYVLFTSGSTGRPKGVAVEHRALANLAAVVARRYGLGPGDRVLQCVAFGFDVALADLFGTWAAGAELHLAGPAERLGGALHARLRDSRITHAAVPPAMVMSLPAGAGPLPDLRRLIVGGEPCPPELVRRWAAPGRVVINAYGPSEAAVNTSTAELRPGRPVTIGRPVPGARVYVLDERLRPVPDGMPGELYIAGTVLARGYAGRPRLTAGHFVADPYGRPGARMYRSGDRARRDARGELHFLGRRDAQVKLRGTRVELGEVESVLAGHPGVAAAAAVVRDDGAGPRLLAYAVGAAGPPPGPAELRTWLSGRLPAAMVPDLVLPLGALPLGPTGKLDRSRLPAAPAGRPDRATTPVAPATATERRVAAAWAAVLGHADIGVHDNFFDVGGDSLRLTAVLAALDGERLTAVDLFSHPTVAALAAHLDRAGDAGPPGPAGRAAHLDRAGDAGPSGPAGRAAHRGRDRRERINRHTNQQKEAGR